MSPPDPTSPSAAKYAPAGAPTNSMAIASLIASIIIAPLGAVLGHVALHQIKRTREVGRGLAIAGLIIGYTLTAIAVITTAILVILIGNAFSSMSDPDGYDLDFRGTWTKQTDSSDNRQIELTITGANPLRGNISLAVTTQAIECTASWKEASRTYSAIVVEAKVTNGPCTNNEWSVSVTGNTMTATQTWSQAGVDTPDLVLRRS